MHFYIILIIIKQSSQNIKTFYYKYYYINYIFYISCGYFSSLYTLYTQAALLRLTLFLLSGFFLGIFLHFPPPMPKLPRFGLLSSYFPASFWVFFFTFRLLCPSCPASAYSLLTFRLLFGYFLHFPPYIPKHPCFGIFRSAFRLIYCVLVCHITQHFPFQNSATSCGTSLSLHSL